MSKFKVNEIFVSYQGEGPDAGRRALFIRFSGCLLNCSFCDTEHEAFEEYTKVELVRKAIEVSGVASDHAKTGRKMLCVLTGGEPLLQLTKPLVKALVCSGFKVAVETSGYVSYTRSRVRSDVELAEMLLECDAVVVSPKNLLTSQVVIEFATALKVLTPLDFPEGDVARWALTLGGGRCAFPELYLQPKTPEKVWSSRGREEFWDNATEAVRIAEDMLRAWNLEFRILPQTHVFMRVR